MDTLVLFHTCPHPLNPSADYPRKPVRFEIFDGPTRGGRRSATALSGAGERARLREQPHLPHRLLRWARHRMITESPLDPDRRALPQGRAGRRLLDARRAQGRDAAHRRPRRQPGRRHAVLQRRRSGRALQRSDTIREQGNIYLDHRHGAACPTAARPMLTIVADTGGRHDTLGGACSTESNTVRYALDKKSHARLPRQLPARGRRERALRARQARHRPQHQLLHERAGDARRRLARSPTASPAPGKYVEMRAEMDVIVLISNCPQLNNPCNAYNPTPVEVLIWGAGP